MINQSCKNCSQVQDGICPFIGEINEKDDFALCFNYSPNENEYNNDKTDKTNE